MLELIVVGLGGFAGSCFRFLFTRLMSQFTTPLPMGTLLSNVIAGILIGFIIGLEPSALALTPKTKLFLTTGLCGGLSTFSTFSLETVVLFGDGKYGMALLNILLNLGISILGVLVGMTLAKLMFRRI